MTVPLSVVHWHTSTNINEVGNDETKDKQTRYCRRSCLSDRDGLVRQQCGSG